MPVGLPDADIGEILRYFDGMEQTLATPQESRAPGIKERAS